MVKHRTRPGPGRNDEPAKERANPASGADRGRESAQPDPPAGPASPDRPDVPLASPLPDDASRRPPADPAVAALRAVLDSLPDPGKGYRPREADDASRASSPAFDLMNVRIRRSTKEEIDRVASVLSLRGRRLPHWKLVEEAFAAYEATLPPEARALLGAARKRQT